MKRGDPGVASKDKSDLGEYASDTTHHLSVHPTVFNHTGLRYANRRGLSMDVSRGFVRMTRLIRPKH